ncbi:BQ5605_C001g00874 [Microbotryum silenes-dioicae]|uniref:BQ5605_C001g00874 protein n=1 Tax=Microbotryum silenes-dioicae TaxID=796604 RepID=A0A2X0MZ03_9BASI|nr:BQ5605_C001g00874 [Microbotryum silenes-dioicae]
MISVAGPRRAHARTAKVLQEANGPYKVPREIEFVENLLQPASGKIRRIELRQAEYKEKAHIVAKQKAKL